MKTEYKLCEMCGELLNREEYKLDDLIVCEGCFEEAKLNIDLSDIK